MSDARSNGRRDGRAVCNVLGHSWVETMDSEWHTDMGVPLTLICERCTDQRWDVVDPRTGELVGRRYVKPDGYTGYSYGERPSRSEFRRALLAQKIRDNRSTRSTR